jgi:outer membrane autotransporter protein
LNYGDNRSDLVFLGAYARYRWAHSFLKAAVQIGHSSNDSTRNANNNLAAGGVETAKGNFGGWYVSPETTLGFNWTLGVLAGGAYTLTPSLRVRYFYASLDGYIETGSAANLTVGARTLQDFEERGELKLSRSQVYATGVAVMTNVYGGVIGVQRLGDTMIGASLLGQAIPFATPGKSDVWGGYAGGGMEWRVTDRFSFFGTAERTWLSDSSTILSGRGGINVVF